MNRLPQVMERDERSQTSQGSVTVIVNGRVRELARAEITYEQALQLAYDRAFGRATAVTVTYARAEGPRHEGSLVAGESVRATGGMVLNVVATDRS